MDSYEKMQKLLGSILNDEPETDNESEDIVFHSTSAGVDSIGEHSEDGGDTDAVPETEQVEGGFDFESILSQFEEPRVEPPVPEVSTDSVPEISDDDIEEAVPDGPAGRVDGADDSGETPAPSGINEGVIIEPEVNLADLLAEGVDDESKPEIIFAEPAAKSEAVIPMPTFTTDEIAESLDIRNFASLVTLNTARWSGKVKDRKASKMAADTAGADEMAFETHKRLLAGADQKLRAVHKAIDDARTRHYNMTLPWSTIGHNDTGKRTGGRLLPHTMFQEYIAAMAKAQQDMKKAADEFESNYQDAINTAQKSLGSRFDPSEYPNPASIRQHFDLTFDFHPIPIGDDFKGLADQQIAKLANTLERKNRTMLENAMQETWTRAYDLVAQAADRFSNAGNLFHYTLIDKLRDAGESLKYLNVTNDPVIEKVRQVIAKKLVMHDAKDIRKDDALRKHLGEIAKACLKEMQSHATS